MKQVQPFLGDIDGDGLDEILLEVMGSESRWFAAIDRGPDGWQTAYQDSSHLFFKSHMGRPKPLSKDEQEWALHIDIDSSNIVLLFLIESIDTIVPGQKFQAVSH